MKQFDLIRINSQSEISERVPLQFSGQLGCI